MVNELDDQPDNWHHDSKDHGEPSNDENILIQDMLWHLAYELVLVIQNVLDVSGRFMHLT